MTDRELLKNTWKDLVLAAPMNGINNVCTFYLMTTADKIREHIREDEGLEWNKEIIDEILSAAKGR